MKVCLIRPPKLMIEGSIPIDPIPPLGIALIAGVLKREKHEVQAIDAIADNCSQFQEEDIEIYSDKAKLNGQRLITMGSSFAQIADIISPDVQVIGISAMFSINWPCDRALIKYLSQRFKNATIIAGGESITGMAETCLQQTLELTACVLGEGEETIISLLSAFEKKADLSTVAGIAYLKNNIPVRTAPRTRIREVDNVPFPAWELLPVEKYKRHPTIVGERPRITLSILATRGCPYECTFCTSPDMWGTRYFMRKPENVVAEIEYVKEHFGATNFEFFDLTAIIQKRWIIAFAQLLIDRNVGITWKIPAGTRSEAIDAEVARYLKKSGCYFITYAPESGSPRLLNLIKKKVSLPNILTSIRHSKEEGMIVFINMILGLPDETHIDVWKTLVFLAKARLAGVDDMPLAIFRPYPGSELFDWLVKNGEINLQTDDYIVESILIVDTKASQRYYNTGIAAFWYRVYFVLAYLFFYGTGYVRHPYLLIQAIRHLFTGQHSNDFERRIAFFRDKLFVKEG